VPHRRRHRRRRHLAAWSRYATGEARKILVTWRTVMYWLSWLPWQRLRKWIADLCCGDERERSVYRLLMLMIGVAFSGQQAAAAPRMARMARMAGPRGAAGAAAETGGDPLADALGADHLLDFMLKDYASLRSEGAASTQHPLWAALLARASDASALAPLAGAPPEVGDLSRKLAELERLVAAQQKQIDKLSRR